jgi:hypothetical protein
MKKLFYLVIAALLATSFTFTSCDKDDDILDSLEGTTWGFSQDGGSISLSFETATLYTLSISGSDIENISGIGSYSYSKPNLTLYLGIGDSAEKLHGTVNGNTLTLIIENVGIILTKK